MVFKELFIAILKFLHMLRILVIVVFVWWKNWKILTKEMLRILIDKFSCWDDCIVDIFFRWKAFLWDMIARARGFTFFILLFFIIDFSGWVWKFAWLEFINGDGDGFTFLVVIINIFNDMTIMIDWLCKISLHWRCI